MKFTVVRSCFLDALQAIQGVVPTKPSLATLLNCLIVAEDNKLILMVTNLDLTMRYVLDYDVQVVTGGRTTLPVKRLISIVHELPEGELTFDIDEDDAARVTCGSTFFKIIGLRADEFPPVLEPVSGEVFFSLEQSIVKDMLRKTAYATSNDETRRALTGVLMQFREGKLTTVATDGKRMALVEQEIAFPDDAACDLILPQQTVKELIRLLSDGKMKISQQNKLVVFEMEHMSISSKLIDGVYAKFQQVIPGSCDERITVEREVFIDALRRVSLVSTDKANSVNMTFENNELTMVTTAPDVGEARETIPLKYIGEPIVTSYNPTFLMECLKTLDGINDVIFELSMGRSPLVVKCQLPFMYVLMPLRLN